MFYMERIVLDSIPLSDVFSNRNNVVQIEL